MFRRYNRWWSRFDQPDPYDGSYDMSNPQSFNRYAYVNNDPVNLIDPSGLMPGDSCFTGSGQPGIEGNDGRCYAGPTDTVDVGGGGEITPFDDPTTYNFVLASIFSPFNGPQNNGLNGLDLWNAGRDELQKRIEEREPCAQLFGGREKALKALNKLEAHMGTLDSPGIAVIKGNNVTLDSTRFTASGFPLKVASASGLTQGYPTYTTRILNLSGVDFAAFAFAHEFGHKSKIYGENDKERGDDLKVALNSEKVRAACFNEF